MSAVIREERSALTRPSSPPSIAALCVLLLALVISFSNLGDTSLPSFDDAYHAQTAKEMLQRGDPITITYGGTPSFQSSPLNLWLMALAYLFFGVGEYAARFPSALLGFSTVILVYIFARRRWSEEAGVAAAFVLTTTLLFIRYSRHAMMEVPLTFFTTLALLCLIAAQRNRRWYLGFGIASGLAILTKSGLGLFPLIIVIVYFLLTGRARELVRPAFLFSILLLLAIAAIWYLPAVLFYQDVFIESHFTDYLVMHTLSGHHAELGFWGPFYYLVRFPIEYLPWIILLLPALFWAVLEWRKDAAQSALWLAIIIPFLILSVITSKYSRYLIPMFPPAALLIAAVWTRRLPDDWLFKVRSGITWICAAGAAAILILPIALSDDRNLDIKALAQEAREVLPASEPVANLDLDFYKYQNPLLFYTDHLLSQPSQGMGELVSDLVDGGNRIGLASDTSFENARKHLEVGIEMEEIARSGDLVLFRLHRLGRAEWIAELQPLVPLIRMLSDSEHLGCYRLPKNKLQRITIKTTGKKLLPPDEKPGQLVRGMLRKEIRLGLGWAAAFGDFKRISPELPDVIPLAETRHLVLFRLQAKPADER